MPNIWEMLRLKNLFGQPDMIGQPPMVDPGGFAGGQLSDMFKPKSDPFGNISFGAQEVTSPQTSAQMASPQPNMDINTRMSQLYTPETEATERFNRMLGEYPQAQKPGWLRVIGATLADMARPGTGMGVIEGDRGRRLSDWKAQIGPSQQAASLERQTNVNERTMAYQSAALQLREEAQDAKQRNDETNAKIRQQRADVYEMKARQPNFKFDFSGPTVMVTDPKTGEIKDSKIPTGSLTDVDKMTLGQEQAMERIAAGGAQARETEGVRQTGRETLAETRGWTIANIPDPSDPSKQIGVKINQITGEVQPVTLGGKGVGPVARPTTGAAAKGEAPTQTKVRQFNAARELMNSRPDLARFIRLNPTGNNFEIDPYSGTNATPEQIREINDAIFGKGNVTVQQPSRTGAPNVPAGRVIVRDAEGNQFTVPRGQLQQAISEGYSEVK